MKTELTKTDLQNLISITNATTFKGAEAETIADLKAKLVKIAQESQEN